METPTVPNTVSPPRRPCCDGGEHRATGEAMGGVARRGSSRGGAGGCAPGW